MLAGMTGRRQRRERERAQRQLVRDLERLARLEPGGAPDRPLPVDSPAVIELRAVARPCPLCAGPLRLEAHRAEVIDGVRLRVATVACIQCGVRRDIHFTLIEAAVH